MKVLIFYQPQSEHARHVEEFVHDFGRDHPDVNLELVNVDSIEGSTRTSVYDIMSYPTFIAVTNDGSMLQHWDGGAIPLMNEVAYYTNK